MAEQQRTKERNDEIRRLRNSCGPRVLAKQFGLTRQQIYQILRYAPPTSRDTWGRMPPRKRSSTTCIYFVQVGPFVKIGIALDLGRRLRQLRASCPFDIELLGTIPGTRVDERALHKTFHGRWHRHEWFKADPVFLEEIEKMIKSSG